MNHKPRYLYSVWRNSDDTLLILDGTADECAKVMEVSRTTFYKIITYGGANKSWTVTKCSIAEILTQSAE